MHDKALGILHSTYIALVLILIGGDLALLSIRVRLELLHSLVVLARLDQGSKLIESLFSAGHGLGVCVLGEEVCNCQCNVTDAWSLWCCFTLTMKQN